MKWYFCLNEHGLSAFAETIVVAAHSAIQNTTLEPHFIYDGSPNALTEYLSEIGVTVHYHTNSFLGLIDAAEATGSYSPEIARGAYLRFDIPLIDKSDDFVIYTDADVVFVDDPVPALAGIRPKILAAAPEYATTPKGYVPYDKVFNSGVMVLNLPAFRAELPALLDLAKSHNFFFHGKAGFYDQGALNSHFEGRWEPLPQGLNWRPFAKPSQSPQIIHFHGTKPLEVGQLAQGENVRPVAKAMYDKDPTAYIMAIGVYTRFLSPQVVQLIRDSVPGARGALLDGFNLTQHLDAFCAFYFNGARISASASYGKPYLREFRAILDKYIVPLSRPVRILEWGSGFTTLLTVSALQAASVRFEIDSLDNFPQYQDSLRRWTHSKGTLNWVVEDITGPGKSQSDPELNYSTWPLAHDHDYDFIFIDGRRRMECAFIAAMIAKPNTVVVIHDFRRGRYQPVLSAFDVIEETEQFRIMKVKPAVAEALDLDAVVTSIA